MVKNKQFQVTLLMFLIFFLSCLDQKNEKYLLEDSELLSVKELPINFMLGNPYQLKIIEHYLIIADYVDNKIIAIYDFNNNQLVNRIIDVGQGPEEMIIPLQIGVLTKNNMIQILQRQTGDYTEHKLDDLLQGLVVTPNKINFGNIERVFKTDNGYIAEGLYSDGDIGFYNNNGEFLTVKRAFPDYLNQINNVSNRYRLGQGEISYNELSKTLIFASYFTGDIRFFSVSKNNLQKIKEYNLDDHIEKRIKSNSTDVEIKPDDIEHCTDITSTSDYFYILYSGETMQNRQNARSSYILKFDSMGKFKKCYKTDRKLFNICISKDNSTMYATILTDKLDYSLAKIIFN